MTEKLIALRINVRKTIEARLNGDDTGQGTLEYIGAVIIAAVIVAAVATAAGALPLDDVLANALTKITGAGGAGGGGGTVAPPNR